VNVRDVLRLSPVIPVLTVTRLEHAAPLAQALALGGLKVLEITLRTECALDAITEMREAAPGAVIGAGTLTRAEDFAAVQRAGAQFAVTPGLTPDLLFGAGETRLPLLPGVMTPTELIAARAAGFRACKLFPAQQAGGVGMLKALAGPFPDVVFCPTGGITRANAAEFLAQPNVACVGGSWLAPRDLVESRDWATIEALARDAASLRQG